MEERERAENLLKEKYNIDDRTIHHNYQYLYRSVISAMVDIYSEGRMDGLNEASETVKAEYVSKDSEQGDVERLAMQDCVCKTGKCVHVNSWIKGYQSRKTEDWDEVMNDIFDSLEWNGGEITGYESRELESKLKSKYNLIKK